VLKKIVDSQTKDLPEDYKELIGRLPVLEQLDFLAKHGDANKLSKRTIPTTPRESGKETTKKPQTTTHKIF
jgi:hypothetical protein